MFLITNMYKNPAGGDESAGVYALSLKKKPVAGTVIVETCLPFIKYA